VYCSFKRYRTRCTHPFLHHGEGDILAVRQRAGGGQRDITWRKERRGTAANLGHIHVEASARETVAIAHAGKKEVVIRGDGQDSRHRVVQEFSAGAVAELRRLCAGAGVEFRGQHAAIKRVLGHKFLPRSD
jgi:hypothetical protein